ncbi:MAG: hypothetical protein R3F56_04375 [Planctomycetota bacterium]
MPQVDQDVVECHEQKFLASCIPACVELVIKLLGKASSGFYDEQNACGDRTDVGFGEFNGKTVCEVTFRHLFTEQRGPSFPMQALFDRIDKELASDRYVIISLASDSGWHMFVVYRKHGDEYHSVSKASPPNGAVTIGCYTVREVVERMQGTDILVYDPL